MDKKTLSVAILGTRGIPNRYGGFEACAEELGAGLLALGHRVTVFCASDHPVKSPAWEGIRRVMVRNPESTLGTAGQFMYDLYCNLHCRREPFDIVLHLGYTSDSVWRRLWTGKSRHVVNMDGLEWKRSKYNRAVRAFLRRAEHWAARGADRLVADNGAIEALLREKYPTPVSYIAYGAKIPDAYATEIPGEYGLRPGEYDLVVARMEPENNIELAIQAKLQAGGSEPLVIIGNASRYRRKLEDLYGKEPRIRFLEAVYDGKKLNSLRHFSRLYVHGHSVGGTNPSLLEAMACGCRIAAHDNPFNRFVLEDQAGWYRVVDELAALFSAFRPGSYESMTRSNLARIRNDFSWETVTLAYEKLFYDALADR